MTYIMRKLIKGHIYLYEYQSIRKDGKPTAKYIRYIGREDKAGKLGATGSVAETPSTGKAELGATNSVQKTEWEWEQQVEAQRQIEGERRAEGMRQIPLPPGAWVGGWIQKKGKEYAWVHLANGKNRYIPIPEVDTKELGTTESPSGQIKGVEKSKLVKKIRTSGK